ncbi:hypothetical protein BKA80DRAFT_256619 [Phyllosticta citrichinensis]
MDTADRSLTGEEEATLDEIKLPYYNIVTEALVRCLMSQYLSYNIAEAAAQDLSVPHSQYGGPSDLCGLQMSGLFGDYLVEDQIRIRRGCQDLSARMIIALCDTPESLRNKIVIYFWRHLKTCFGEDFSKWPDDPDLLPFIRKSIDTMGSEASLLEAYLPGTDGLPPSDHVPESHSHPSTYRIPLEHARPRTLQELLDDVPKTPNRHRTRGRGESAPGLVFGPKDTNAQTTVDAAEAELDNPSEEASGTNQAKEPESDLESKVPGSNLPVVYRARQLLENSARLWESFG